MPNARFITIFAVSCLVACGGKSFGVDPSEGGSDPGGSNQGGSGQKAGSSHGGSVNPGGAPPGGTGQGGNGGALCESFDDEPGLFIAVEIHNQTNATIHLGDEMANCGGGVLDDYRIDDASGNGLPRPGFCRQPCRAVRQGGPLGCPTICGAPVALTLQPGEVYYTSWDGLLLEQIELPAQCLVQPEYGGTCDMARAIEPGTFTFTSRAGHELTCADGFGNAADPSYCQSCLPSGNGGCLSNGAVIGGELITATTKVLLDGSYGVYGSFPPPAPAFPGDVPGGAIAYQAVQIIFE
jgi:hypothetical protein